MPNGSILHTRGAELSDVRLLQEHCASTHLLIDRHPPFWTLCFPPWFCFCSKRIQKQQCLWNFIRSVPDSGQVMERTYPCYPVAVPTMVLGIQFCFHIALLKEWTWRTSKTTVCWIWCAHGCTFRQVFP